MMGNWDSGAISRLVFVAFVAAAIFIFYDLDTIWDHMSDMASFWHW